MKHISIALVAFVITIKCFSQNVGIGTSTPASKLTIEGIDNGIFSRNAVLQFTNAAPGANNNWYLRPGATGTQTPAGGFSIGDKTSNRLVIDSNGNVGIGTNPQFTLEVARGISPNGTARFSGSANPTQFNYGAAEHTYISGGLATSNVMLNFFGSGNVGVGQGNVPFATLDVARGSGQATAYFHGTSQNSMFNFGTTEETYIRGGKSGSDVYINDLNGGKLRVGGNTAPTATLEVNRGNGTNGTAMFRGTSFNTKFNADTSEHTYIQGGKAGSNILLNYYGGANVGVGTNLVPASSFEVARGTGTATANFHGSFYSSLFNNGVNEETFIRGGKPGSDVYINDNNSANVRIGGTAAPAATLDVSRGVAPGGTAMLRGTVFSTQFNYDIAENTYIRGGKTGSDVYINDNNAGRAVIGTAIPSGTLSVKKNSFHPAGATILGSNFGSYFLYGTNEDTYIQGGKPGSNLFLCDSTNGNVKIGSGNIPVARLDVDKGTGLTGTALFRGSSYYSLFNSDSSENTFIRGGKNGSDVYINDNNNGRVKIGATNTPQAQLDVSRGSGQSTAAFWGTNYGSLFNSNSTEDTYITGGKNNSNVIINNITGGKTGIGVYPTITDGVLDVNGRMRIRSGGDLQHSAGIWLNSTSNTTQAAFIGMEDSIHVGFAGPGFPAFKFQVNTTNGALKINGDEGYPGAVLTSNGTGMGPSWQSTTNALYNNARKYVQQSPAHITCSACFNELIFTSATPFTVSGNAKALVSYSGFVNPLSTGLFSSDTRVTFTLYTMNSNGDVFQADEYKMVAMRGGGSSFSKTIEMRNMLSGTYYYRLVVTVVSGDTGAGTDVSDCFINSVLIHD